MFSNTYKLVHFRYLERWLWKTGAAKRHLLRILDYMTTIRHGLEITSVIPHQAVSYRPGRNASGLTDWPGISASSRRQPVQCTKADFTALNEENAILRQRLNSNRYIYL